MSTPTQPLTADELQRLVYLLAVVLVAITAWAWSPWFPQGWTGAAIVAGQMLLLGVQIRCFVLMHRRRSAR